MRKMTIQELVHRHKFKSVIARRLGVSHKLVSYWYYDQQKITYRMWKRIKKVFDVEIIR